MGEIIIGKDYTCSSSMKTKRLVNYDKSEERGIYIFENIEAFIVCYIYSCSVVIKKDTKQGKQLDRWIEEEKDSDFVFVKIKYWVLKRISIKHLESFILNIGRKCFIEGQKEIKEKFRKLLGV